MLPGAHLAVGERDADIAPAQEPAVAVSLRQPSEAAEPRLADALLALWPTDAEPEPIDEAGLGGFGWLPQRYNDGWFLRRGDARVPLTDGRMRAWQKSAARRART